MFSIRFYNETGEIIFGGGSSLSPWKLTAAEGLSFSGKSFTVAKYAGQDGQETTTAVDNARTITLRGDLVVGEDFAKQYSSAISALEKKGWLEIKTVLGVRRIEARCCDYRQVDRKGKFIIYIVQFICDCPYFEDAIKSETPIFQQIPLLDAKFTFPAKFSERVSKNLLSYEGTAKTEPTFIININEGTDGDNVLALYNHTSGESLKINYSAILGECVTVDVKNRKIYNSKGDNLIKYLADDSFFDGFFLYPGINDIEVLNNNMNTGIDVICRYSTRYSEAVII